MSNRISVDPKTRLIVSDNIIWITEDDIQLTIDNIDDHYLKEIIKYVATGGGHHVFLNQYHINKLFELAYSHKLFRPDIILNYNAWAEYWQLEGSMPHTFYSLN